MQMEMLRCLSPARLHREVLLHLIAYNLIRGMMAEAAAIYDRDVARISFKGSVQTVRHFSQVIAQATSRRKAVQLTNDLLQTLAQALVPARPTASSIPGAIYHAPPTHRQGCRRFAF